MYAIRSYYDLKSELGIILGKTRKQIMNIGFSSVEFDSMNNDEKFQFLEYMWKEMKDPLGYERLKFKQRHKKEIIDLFQEQKGKKPMELE